MTAGFSDIRDPLYPVRESRRYYADRLPRIAREVAGNVRDNVPAEHDLDAGDGLEFELEADGQGDEGPGRWAPIGSQKGLPTGPVEDLDPFLRTMEGQSPDGRHRVRDGGDGTRNIGFDLTFSLPKGVSLYVNALEETGRKEAADAIRKDAQDAVMEALDIAHGEGVFVGRRGSARGGTLRREVVSGVPATLWHHKTSRSNDDAKQARGDPQEHIHVYIPNVSKRIDGTFGALERAPIAAAKMMVGALFRTELSSRLASRGLALREEGRGQFDVDIARQVTEAFSTRRRKILDVVEAETGERRTDGRRARLAAKVAIDTRGSKEKLPPLPEMKKEWTGRLSKRGVAWSDIVREAERGPVVARPALGRDAGRQVLAKLDRGVLEKQDVIAAVAANACADGSLNAREALKQAKEMMRALPRLDRGRKAKAMGSPVAAERELRILQDSIGRRNEPSRLTAADARKAAVRLDDMLEGTHGPGVRATDRQRDDLKRLVSGAGGVQVLAGPSGSGKTDVLAAAAQAHRDAGYRVTAVATSWNAAEYLADRAGLRDARALQGFAGDLSAGRFSLRKDDVVVVDDAGSASVEDLGTLLSHASRVGAKVILCGDERRSPEKGNLGAGFRTIVEAAWADLAARDQRMEPGLRRTAVDLSAGRVTRCLERLIDAGKVEAVREPHAALERAAKQAVDWILRDVRTGRPEKEACRESLAICRTHADARRVAGDIRARLQDAGIVGREEIGIRACGGEVGRYQVEHELKVARGDRLALLEQLPGKGLLNGDVLLVRGAARDADGVAFLDVYVERDGRRMSIVEDDLAVGNRPLRMQYAAAVSATAARAMSADRVVVAADRLVDREKAVAALGRHRVECRVVVALDRSAAADLSTKDGKQDALRAWAGECQRKADRMNIADHLTRSQVLTWIRKGEIAAMPGLKGPSLEDRAGEGAFTRQDAARIRMAAENVRRLGAHDAAALVDADRRLANAAHLLRAADQDREVALERPAAPGKPREEQQRAVDAEQARQVGERLREMALQRERERDRGPSM
ncbi:hypothetical protein CHU95_03340 [Niveispirillum lacus]|uniref:AAA+ ATPase domain-containing protein n=1 Tax=Niveispirillum lacus TaxID=1981099 RepID=A0A255Z5U9_9PROT|nr:MobF family relaxase [Niveispirillum lacus]OYQ36819.1 hypothetical protein CHU95_03340 [Niveispirillum lacus]